jgi:hypothetical protein
VETEYAVGGDPGQWLFAHLYNPRQDPQRWKSTCPPHKFLFDKHKVTGSPSINALPFGKHGDTELVPSSEAKALVSYLLSLKKDQAVPAVLNFAPAKAKTAP